jgi:hypothetical protein
MNTRNGRCDEPQENSGFCSVLDFLSTAAANTRALGGHSSGALLGHGGGNLHNRICKGMNVPILEGRIYN